MNHRNDDTMLGLNKYHTTYWWNSLPGVKGQLIDWNPLPISQDAGTTPFSVKERKEAGYKRNHQPQSKQQSTTKSHRRTAFPDNRIPRDDGKLHRHPRKRQPTIPYQRRSILAKHRRHKAKFLRRLKRRSLVYSRIRQPPLVFRLLERSERIIPNLS